MLYENVGPRLKEERIRIKLNQEDLASIGGVGKNAQINYERVVGEKMRRAPDADYLALVSKAGIDVQYVLTGERRFEGGDGMQVPVELRQMVETWIRLWSSHVIDAETIELCTRLVAQVAR